MRGRQAPGEAAVGKMAAGERSALDSEAHLLQRCRQHLLQRIKLLEEEEQHLKKQLLPSQAAPHVTAAMASTLQPAARSAAIPFNWRRPGAPCGSLSDSGCDDDDGGAAAIGGKRGRVEDEDSFDDDLGLDDGDDAERLRQLAASESARRWNQPSGGLAALRQEELALELVEGVGGDSSPWVTESSPAWLQRSPWSHDSSRG